MEVSPIKRLCAGFIRGGNSAEVAQGKKMNERVWSVDRAQTLYLRVLGETLPHSDVVHKRSPDSCTCDL